MLKKKIYDVKLEILDLEVSVFAPDEEFLVGKTISYDLTKLLKGKNCEARFRIKKEGESLFATIYFFMIYPQFVKKMIGKNVSVVEDSFLVKCKDAVLRIKPFLITRKRVHRSVRAALREKAREIIVKSFTEKTRKEAFQEILSSSLQKSLGKKLKKIYPLSVCEIRMAKVEKTNEI
ncbi:MAG: hypothetical protein QXQ82_01305 [Candidatus Pacearchaeota archaeon]